MSGLFANMNYVNSSYGSVYFPKLLGTYEREITSALRRFLEISFEKIVVAGAAEGYYAVGLALRTNADIHAFEAQPKARLVLRELAQKNGMDTRVQVGEICDAPNLAESMARCRPVLVLMDIEGGESILLDPDVVPALNNAYILVEMHEFIIPGVTAIVKKRFESTHVINEIHSERRSFSDFPISKNSVGKLIFEGAAVQLMQEGRPLQMSWLAMHPISLR